MQQDIFHIETAPKRSTNISSPCTLSETDPTSSLIILFITLSILVALVSFPSNTILLQRLSYLLALLILHLVPVNIILVRNSLDLSTQRVRFFNQALPLTQIEAACIVEFRLPFRDGVVHSRAVRDFAVVVEEPDVGSYDG